MKETHTHTLCIYINGEINFYQLQKPLSQQLIIRVRDFKYTNFRQYNHEAHELILQKTLQINEDATYIIYSNQILMNIILEVNFSLYKQCSTEGKSNKDPFTNPNKLK